MSRIKIIAFYLAIIFFYSCGARKATVEKQDVKIFQTSEIKTTAPGAIIQVPLAMPLKERPRRETKVYLGENGAKSIVTFDDKGIVTNILSICPEVEILKKENAELQIQLKQKEVERKGMSFGRMILIILAALLVGFILGWIFRGRIKIPLLDRMSIFDLTKRKNER